MALAEALKIVSHDRLTSMVQARGSGHMLVEGACRTWFVWEHGYLVIDETVRASLLATVIEGLAWVCSSQERRSVYGLFLVLVVWTNGVLRIPLGMWLWHQGGPSNDSGMRAIQSPALSPSLCPLRCLVSVQASAQNVCHMKTFQNMPSAQGRIMSVRTASYRFLICSAARRVHASVLFVTWVG